MKSTQNFGSTPGRIEVVTSSPAWLLPFDERQIRNIAIKMAEAAQLSEACIEINLVVDSQIAALNISYLDCAGPTNVITFPCEDGEGSIFISLDCLRREAFLYGQKPAFHFITLLAHGFGHLGNYEHGALMRKIESACIAAAMTYLEA